MACTSTVKAIKGDSGPRSWEEDLQTYRTARGSCQYSVLKETSAPERFGRTTLCPLGGTRNKQYSCGDDNVAGDCSSSVDTDRFRRHGWGSTKLLKLCDSEPAADQDSNASATWSTCRQENIKYISPIGGTPGTVSQDAWLGNRLMNPNKGRLHVLPSADKKGRKDLFQVINQRDPAKPADDSWMGHVLVDPSKGKARAPGPEQRLGRQDLFEVMQQNAARSSTRVDGRGSDGALTDAWIGHMLIHPAKGKASVPETLSKQDHLSGSRIVAPVHLLLNHKEGRRPGIYKGSSTGAISEYADAPGQLAGAGTDARFFKGKRIIKPAPGERELRQDGNEQGWKLEGEGALKILQRAKDDSTTKPWK
eukprot:jgi/Botrbrau1/12492/Bobra.0169s0039.1